MELCQGLAKVLVRLCKPPPPPRPPAHCTRAPARAPRGHHALRGGQTPLGAHAAHVHEQEHGLALEQELDPARARWGGAAVCRRPHSPRGPDSEGEAQVPHLRAPLPEPHHRAREQPPRGAQDQEHSPDGGAHAPRVHGGGPHAVGGAPRARQLGRPREGGPHGEAAAGEAGSQVPPLQGHQPQGATQAHGLGHRQPHRRRGAVGRRADRGGHGGPVHPQMGWRAHLPGRGAGGDAGQGLPPATLPGRVWRRAAAPLHLPPRPQDLRLGGRPRANDRGSLRKGLFESRGASHAHPRFPRVQEPKGDADARRDAGRRTRGDGASQGAHLQRALVGRADVRVGSGEAPRLLPLCSRSRHGGWPDGSHGRSSRERLCQRALRGRGRRGRGVSGGRWTC
mmetsp:Transcript_24100/g.65212  ORF Transcript_24100/g.65212 Transcript_24100/m.65212 type:complete len:395 (+) Transcript_24100:964-2148(+)